MSHPATQKCVQLGHCKAHAGFLLHPRATPYPIVKPEVSLPSLSRLHLRAARARRVSFRRRRRCRCCCCGGCGCCGDVRKRTEEHKVAVLDIKIVDSMVIGIAGEPDGVEMLDPPSVDPGNTFQEMQIDPKETLIENLALTPHHVDTLGNSQIRRWRRRRGCLGCIRGVLGGPFSLDYDGRPILHFLHPEQLCGR